MPINNHVAAEHALTALVCCDHIAIGQYWDMQYNEQTFFQIVGPIADPTAVGEDFALCTPWKWLASLLHNDGTIFPPAREGALRMLFILVERFAFDLDHAMDNTLKTRRAWLQVNLSEEQHQMLLAAQVASTLRQTIGAEKENAKISTVSQPKKI